VEDVNTTKNAEIPQQMIQEIGPEVNTVKTMYMKKTENQNQQLGDK
jgi:hypothetical protein